MVYEGLSDASVVQAAKISWSSPENGATPPYLHWIGSIAPAPAAMT
jgi:hypothetical protein